MKLSVKIGFIDKDTNIFHKVGEVVEYPEKRAKEIESRGFGKIVGEPKPTKKETKEPVEEKPKTEEPKKVSRKSK
jgi:hypothetical protein